MENKLVRETPQLAVLLLVVLLLAIGQAAIPAWAAFLNSERSNDNEMNAYVPDLWMQTSQADFETGVFNQVDTSTSPGDVLLQSRSNWYSQPWYDANWGYRVPVAISNSGSTSTNYQVKVTIPYDSDMQSDFDDIRFANSDETTTLPHWRENYTASGTATFWVKIPSLPRGIETIYAYYGNSGASSASSVSDTFTSGSSTDSFNDQTGVSNSSNVVVNSGSVTLNQAFVDQTAFSDSFELENWDDNGPTMWASRAGQSQDGTHSAFARNNQEGYLTSDDIDLSSASSASLSFWFRKDDVEAADFTLYFWDGSSYNLIQELDDYGISGNGGDDTWIEYDETIDLGTYDNSDFEIVFDATLGNGERVWVDQLVLTADASTVFSDSFELDNWNDNGINDWWLSAQQQQDGAHSARAANNDEGFITSDDIDLSDAVSASLDFWFRKDDTEANDFTLYFWDGSSYNLIDELDNNGTDDTWLNYNDVPITTGTYDNSDFQIRFDATLANGENVWVDQITVTKQVISGFVLSGSLTSVSLPTDTTTRLASGNQLSWTDTEPSGTDAKYQILYNSGTSTWIPIPDSDLPGNSTGFDTSPIDMSSIKSDYTQIRLRGNLNSDSSNTPNLADWTVSYYYREYSPIEPTTSLQSEQTYDPDWTRRVPITIDNTGGGSLTDYQVRITVPYGSDMDVNFDDIRFTDGDETTPISHWREDYTASTSAVFWIEVPSIPASGTKSIYAYYGNSGGWSASDGAATFEFFDDFSVDLSRWAKHRELGGAGTIKIENGYLECGGGNTTGDYGHSVVGSDPTYPSFQNGIVEGKVYLATNSIAEISYRGNYAANTGYKSRIDARTGEGSSHLTPPYAGWGFVSGCGQTGTGISIGVWLDYSIQINGTSLYVTCDGQTRACTDSTYSGSGEISLQNHYGTYSRYDDVRVRKYASVEPTNSIGSEETLYYSPGTVSSQVFNTGSPSAVMNAVFWDKTLQTSTDITFEVRTSDISYLASAGSPAWIAVGGTSPAISGLPSGRYMQWRATLTSDGSWTPTLHEIRLYYY
jgi:hypothetical protein